MRPGEHDPHKTLTRHQRLVLDALSRAEMPLGAYGLRQQLQGHGLKAPLQVYRALHRLIDLGLVHRLESLNAFVACACRDEHPHAVAFAICNTCGQVTEFPAPVVEEGLARWSDGHGFKPDKITVEMRGLCGTCRNGPPVAASRAPPQA